MKRLIVVYCICLLGNAWSLRLAAQSFPPELADPDIKRNPRVWLVVEALERISSPGKSSLAFNDQVKILVLDSASQTPIYTRSGELTEVGRGRTYYISIVQPSDVRYLVEKESVLILRTPVILTDDLVFQRDFTVARTSTGLDPLPYQISEPLYVPQPYVRLDTSGVDQELYAVRRDVAELRRNYDDVRPSYHTNPLLRRPVPGDYDDVRYDMDLLPLRTPSPSSLRNTIPAVCNYVVQFCAVPIEREAIRIAGLLAQDAVRDARVEYVEDLSRNLRMYRVRGGCFASAADARQVLSRFKAASERLRLGVSPIVVKSP